MYLGIDVGGTHTDGALLADDFSLTKSVKVDTRHGDVLGSFLAALAPLLATVDPRLVRRLVVSSTLGLNAVLTGQADQVGVLAVGGPGLPPDLSGQALAMTLAGSQDHRGEILSPLKAGEAEKAALTLKERGATAFAVISKFGPKNQVFEEALALAIERASPASPLTRASRLSGRLGFPRRLNTAVFNSSVTRLYQNFTRDLESAVRQAGLTCPVYLLGSDGGPLSLGEAVARPAQILAAGPAAGLLGLWAMTELPGDALMLDVGGTSSDLALMADGRPLMYADGLEIAGRPTFVRAFLTHSVPLGGDSSLMRVNGSVTVGPERVGPALALAPRDLGRRPPTLSDALNVLGLSELGEVEVSRQALAALDSAPPEEMARQALETALVTLKMAADLLLHRVNQRPVYTVDKIRLARPLKPEKAAILGGPAQALAKPLEEALGLTAIAPEEAGVANAIGAALARPTLSAELYADTALGSLSIPTLGLSRAIDRGYDLKMAERDLLAVMGQIHEKMPEAGPLHITEAESFHQLTGYGRSEKIIRVRAQAAPGILGGQP